MPQRKPRLDDLTDAILARDGGMPYQDVLETFGITPMQFSLAVNRVSRNIELPVGGRHEFLLSQILTDKTRRVELFRMGEEFIREQYLAVQAMRALGVLTFLAPGLSEHPENIENLIWIALTNDKPELASKDRQVVITALENLPVLQDYLRGLGLGGVIVNALDNAYNEVIHVFDSAYQRRIGDASLFDLAQARHLHAWGNGTRRQAPSSYWKAPTHVEEAIYHVLGENNPLLASNRRADVILGLKQIQEKEHGLQVYLNSLGLDGVMESAFKGAVWKLLHAFDRAYRNKTGDEFSLFDLSQPEHAHPWGDGAYASKSYWEDRSNVCIAVFHLLAEAHPKLGSKDRAIVQQGIRELPRPLDRHFQTILYSGLYNFIASPSRTLGAFDEEYQRRTGDRSLFEMPIAGRGQ